MWSRTILLVMVSVLGFTSCKTKRKMTMPSHDTPMEISAANAASIKTFEMNNLDFHTCSGRANTKIEMGKNVHDVPLNVRIERNKAIWLSVKIGRASCRERV